MFLSEPGQTTYDINFSFLGFPVRVHPAFFILPLFLGKGMVPIATMADPEGMNMGAGLVLVAAIFFVSILIHELGHAVAFRYYGISSRIVLYWMGGLAIPGGSGGNWGSSWGNRQSRASSLKPNQQIVVSLAGPVFGFLLAAVLVGIVYLVGGHVILNDLNVIPLPQPELGGTFLAGNGPAIVVLWGGIFLNIILNLFNLVPVYPLDGGQVARQLMIQMDPQDGPRNSIYLSIAAAVLLALFCFSMRQQYMAFFMGFMAWSNYQTLQRFTRPW